MPIFQINTPPSGLSVPVKEIFDNSCTIELSEKALESLKSGKLNIHISKHQNSLPLVTKLKVKILSTQGNITIHTAPETGYVFFDEGSRGSYNIKLWRKANIYIGKGTTSNNTRIMCNNSEFICGEDCMFSDGVLIQSADEHGIVDLESGNIVNNQFNSVVLGNHVWLGRQCTLMGKAKVGDGSVISTGAIVTGEISSYSIAGGVPAKVLKKNHTWSRSPMALDNYSSNLTKNI